MHLLTADGPFQSPASAGIFAVCLVLIVALTTFIVTFIRDVNARDRVVTVDEWFLVAVADEDPDELISFRLSGIRNGRHTWVAAGRHRLEVRRVSLLTYLFVYLTGPLGRLTRWIGATTVTLELVVEETGSPDTVVLRLRGETESQVLDTLRARFASLSP